jgi:hypothetical protein
MMTRMRVSLARLLMIHKILRVTLQSDWTKARSIILEGTLNSNCNSPKTLIIIKVIPNSNLPVQIIGSSSSQYLTRDTTLRQTSLRSIVVQVGQVPRGPTEELTRIR